MQSIYWAGNHAIMGLCAGGALLERAIGAAVAMAGAVSSGLLSIRDAMSTRMEGAEEGGLSSVLEPALQLGLLAGATCLTAPFKTCYKQLSSDSANRLGLRFVLPSSAVSQAKVMSICT
jgi:hypothetical protein